MSLRVAPPALATADALPEIVELLERVFPRERPWGPDLEWQYLKNPSGPALYVNAYADSGAPIAHYALLPIPPASESPVACRGTYLSLNVAADPTARVPGLMVATTRALFRHLLPDGPALVLGVANENSASGFVRMLGFRPLGKLSLTVHPPGGVPVVEVPRALDVTPAHLAWRAARPGVKTYAAAAPGALTARLRHRGLPLDAVLTTGLSSELLRPLGLPPAARWAPRLYAGFGGKVRGGIAVPDRIRPSPLEYIYRVFGDPALTEPVGQFLLARRFEFLDFDVV